MAPTAATDAVKLSVSGGPRGAARLLWLRRRQLRRATLRPGHILVVQPTSLADPLGRFWSFFPDPSAAIDFFSSRHRTPLRPSMREAALARSASKTLVASGLGKDGRLQGSSGRRLNTV
ncbi:hypothetical protein E2562_031800 [Oryza meyeriana var. granulata]|uniref:Uncharacterized protein n=1 Tax=Oryza meyeriana var. granulata TaxID=110450 RepID=A0A6G1EBZ6_9ORYZ|nr:hypothetical protein E2562_031800 [Oryza meyeriana var. granulata]